MTRSGRATTWPRRNRPSPRRSPTRCARTCSRPRPRGCQQAAPDATLRSDIHEARRYNRALHTLHRKGLNGGAFETLATSGNLQAVQYEAGLSRHQIGRYEHLFNVRQRLTSATGQYAGDVRFGRQLDKANNILDRSRAHLHDLNQQMKHLNAEVAHLRKEAAHNAKKTGDAVGDKINGTSAKAKRRVSS
jgi:hypothetical protein